MKESDVTEPSAAEICQRFELSEESRALLSDGAAAVEFLQLLIEREKWTDAVNMLSNMLPKREAVWWAAQTARQLLGEKPRPEIEAAIKSAETWVANGTDESRRAAWPMANKAGMATAAGCAAMGAYLSGGSLSPPDQEPLPPDESLTARMVAASIVVSVVSGDAKAIKELFTRFLNQGTELYLETRKQAATQSPS